MAPAAVLKAERVHMLVLDDDGAVEREAAAAAAATRQRVEVDAAYEAGVADGQRAAEAAGLGAMPDVAVAIKAANAELADLIANRAAADAGALVGFAAEIARWILGRELAEDPGLVVGRIEAALEAVIPNGRLVVRVAPEAVDLVSRWAEGRDAEIVGDPSLTPGEARLEAGDAGADLTWAQAFSRVRDAFHTGDVAP
jgi:flagellar biosynthesis/type III secretory pathway protein FliH